MEYDYGSNVTFGYNYSVDGNLSFENGSGDWIAQNSPEYYVAALILSWTNAVLIISLNTAVIVTILRYKKRSRLYFLLLHLAIADLLTGITDAIPHSIERTIGLPYFQMLWMFGEMACKIQRAVANMPMTSSNYILAATSLDRAMVVFKPMLSFKRGTILQKCIIVSCWLFSAIVSVPYLIFVTTKPNQGMPHANCGIVWGEEYSGYMWKVFIVTLFIYVFVIPFSIIVASYAILLVSIFQRALTPQCSYRNQMTNAGLHVQVFNSGQSRSKMKSLKLTCGIVLGFLFSWSILFIFMFMNIFAGFNSSFMMIVVTFYYWNSVVNPVMFFIYHRRTKRLTTSSIYSSDTTKNRAHVEMKPHTYS